MRGWTPAPAIWGPLLHSSPPHLTVCSPQWEPLSVQIYVVFSGAEIGGSQFPGPFPSFEFLPGCSHRGGACVWVLCFCGSSLCQSPSVAG